ncbi:MAG TPA: ATP synthase F0 subunit B [Terriglobia bacterium]|jgi:F-type H+-transporting ATPase subunit b
MKKILALLILSVWICGSVSVVRAQEQGAGAEAQHEESPVRVIARWANFIVLFAGLAFLLRKPMSEFFKTRQTEIASGLRRAQDAQTSAQARMDEIEKRLANLTSEIENLSAAAQQESLAEREKILADAKHEVERVVEQSRQEIERVARAVEREIKEHVADQVIDRAGNALRTEMTQDDQKRIIVRFIQNL